MSDTKIDQIMKDTNPTEPARFNFTDAGNAELIAHLYGDRVRWDRRRSRWLVWNGYIWKPEADDVTIAEFATKAARTRQYEAINIEHRADKDTAMKWGLASESRQKIDAAVDLAKGKHPIKDEGYSWDTDPWLFACANGVIDLRTGELRAAKPEDKITMSSPVKYYKEATRERWEQFLDEVFEGDTELIHYLHKALGYSMTGDMREQSVFIGHGAGGNGKSKLFEVIRYVMGTYAQEAAPATFYKVYNRSNDFELPAIEGKRLITIAENDTASSLDTQRIKRISGGDPITAAEKHKKEVTFEAVGKLWMYFNNKPEVTDKTISIWDRLKLIPFNAEFRNTAKEDKNLPEKLRAEAEGILAWLVEGCLIWQVEGLKPLPKAVASGVSEYQRENDQLADFLYQSCEEGEDKSTMSSEIRNKYILWAEREGLQKKEIMSQKEFTRRMGEKYKSKRTKAGVMFFGVGLVSSPSHEVQDQATFSTISREELIKENNVKTTSNPTSSLNYPTPAIKVQLDKQIIARHREGKLPASLMTKEQQEMIKQSYL